jgi:hypothetical protein
MLRSRLKEKFAHNGYQIHVQEQKEGPVTGKDISVRILGSNEVSIITNIVPSKPCC